MAAAATARAAVTALRWVAARASPDLLGASSALGAAAATAGAPEAAGAAEGAAAAGVGVAEAGAGRKGPTKRLVLGVELYDVEADPFEVSNLAHALRGGGGVVGPEDRRVLAELWAAGFCGAHRPTHGAAAIGSGSSGGAGSDAAGPRPLAAAPAICAELA